MGLQPSGEITSPSEHSTQEGASTAPTIKLEIERKWRVREMPDLTNATAVEMVQGYIVIGQDGTEVRLRQEGDKFFQTVKGDGNKVRTQPEIELTAEQFAELWPTTEGKRIEKTRYKIPYEGFTIELDVYKGRLEGLMIVEVEFDTIRDSELFQPLDWFGPEVTDNKDFKNKALATSKHSVGYYTSELAENLVASGQLTCEHYLQLKQLADSPEATASPSAINTLLRKAYNPYPGHSHLRFIDLELFGYVQSLMPTISSPHPRFTITDRGWKELEKMEDLFLVSLGRYTYIGPEQSW